jgi:hypothetical protein
MGRLARFVRLKKFMGDDFAGPAETATAKATMAAATEAFMSIVGLAKIGKVENLSDWKERSASECDASSKELKEDSKGCKRLVLAR